MTGHPASIGSGRPRAVFLDRDGTLNPDPGYISSPDDFSLFPGTAESLAALRQAGFLLILVTNQSGIARGLIRPADLCRIHAKLQRELLQAGAALDRIYVCPHHPDFSGPGARSVCDCRKPAPGLVLRAIADLDIDPAGSYVIGDRESDVKMGIAAGVPSILIASGPASGLSESQYFRFPDLGTAVRWILTREL